ncbi:Stk1 family PASTA domain-containing Ser/Thr kinase [Cellulomonas sp. PhB143]|uniref:Stk1 family PASTA domain-containing Ser/Thr kinase n=1 Tax=Cellulomonas sp. PhB143 TaxID=2485186 RepID=UPI000F49E0ED|nr:Stk1 family PASTA domain-containing Ser/Thr kinase [Cellulomonas sp. PhB143]ROS73006.1 serine/threonine-protein kinase [Cellulomonas sp. PhB143]
MTTVTSDSLVGRTVDGRYHVVSRIARGGMATVYLAHDRRLDREVALKVMHAHLADGVDGVDFVSRFRREARAAARLAHPGLVAVFDQGLDGDTSYLTMEYVEGSNLRRRLRAERTLSVGDTLEALCEILDALAAAHRAGLVHRDVKPENVLIDTDSRLKLTDFGLARAVTEVTTTTAGTILGTVAYMAPELIRAAACDARADVYSVGILAYEMLTGSLPYPGDTPIQVAFAHVSTDIPAPSAVFGALPVELDELVASLAARDPDERPADAGDALARVRATFSALSEADLALRREPGPADETAGEDPPGEGAAPAPEPAPGTSLDEIPTTAFDGLGPQRRDALVARSGGTRELAPHRPRRWRRAVAWALALVLVLGASGAGAWWWFTEGPGAYASVPQGLDGSAARAAEATLDAAGIDHTTTTAYSDDVPAGQIVSTAPDAGGKVRKDGSVELVVSQGVRMVTVPEKLVGESEADASAALTGRGFTVGDPNHAYDDTAPAGTVLESSVEEGSTQRHDTTVVLTVSDGPAPVDVPSVTGMTKDDATGALDDAGLTTDTSEDYSEDVPAGRVVSQDPASGADAHRGDTVSVVVSQGPPLVEVPSVVDQKVEAAQKTLEKAGFVVEIKELFGSRPLDRVLFQDKKAGDSVPKGSTIKLTVT